MLACLACGSLAAAQADAGPLLVFSRAGESAHVTLYAQERAPDVHRFERELRDVARALGDSALPRLQLFYYEHASDVAVATGRYAGGVTFAGLSQIHSTAYRLRHEMVHLIASRFGGDPGAFFQEGLAVAVGDGGRHSDGRAVDDVARGSLRATALSTLVARFASTDPQEAYPVAGSFMRFLLKRHGTTRVLRFFKDSTLGARGEAFQNVFGESLDATGSLWMTRLCGDCSHARPRADPLVVRRPDPRSWPMPPAP
jgi:hypothetical protein